MNVFRRYPATSLHLGMLALTPLFAGAAFMLLVDKLHRFSTFVMAAEIFAGMAVALLVGALAGKWLTNRTKWRHWNEICAATAVGAYVIVVGLVWGPLQ